MPQPPFWKYAAKKKERKTCLTSKDDSMNLEKRKEALSLSLSLSLSPTLSTYIYIPRSQPPIDYLNKCTKTSDF
jgi:hypothetical protein